MSTNASTLPDKQGSFLKTAYPTLIIFLCATFLFYKYILQVYPSIITNQLMQEFNLDGVELGNLAATFFYAYLVTQLFVGVLIDRFGTRLLATAALGLCAIGAYYFSRAHTLADAELSRTMMGAGVAFATVTYMKMNTVWVPAKHFALVAGLLVTAAMFGAVFGQAPLAFMVNAIGWRHTLWFCSLAGLILAVLFLLIIRNSQKEDPFGVGTHSSAEDKEDRNLSFKDVWRVLKSKQNWCLTFYSGLAFSPVAAFGGLWGDPFLERAYNLSHTSAAFASSLIFFGLAFGGPILGWWAEKVDEKRKVMLLSVWISLVCLFAIIYLQGLPELMVDSLLLVFGFFTGAFMLAFSIGRDINKLTLAATVVAMINTGEAILSALTEPLVGKFLDLGWHGKIVEGVHYFSLKDYHLALMVLPLYLLIAVVFLYLIKEPIKTSSSKI